MDQFRFGDGSGGREKIAEGWMTGGFELPSEDNIDGICG